MNLITQEMLDEMHAKGWADPWMDREQYVKCEQVETSESIKQENIKRATK